MGMEFQSIISIISMAENSMNTFFDSLRKFRLPFFGSLGIYADLGTSTTRLAIKDKGIVLKEPTYLAFNSLSRSYIFCGREAKDIVGKTPEFLKIVRPMVGGIVSDFDAEVAIIRFFIEKSIYPYLRQFPLVKPTLSALAAYPVIATEIEQKAVEEVMLKAGCASVNMIERPLATAAGCGLDIFSHTPNLIVDLGGGITEISVVSGGGIVASKTIKHSGEHMDKLIGNYIYLKHGVTLGEATCERLKTELFTFEGENKMMVVRGKSLENGLPKSIKITSLDVKEALLTAFMAIVDAIKELVELSPPEIVDEIYERGILLTGQFASVKGLERFFKDEIKIETTSVKNYQDATINGLMLIDKLPGAAERLNTHRFS